MIPVFKNELQSNFRTLVGWLFMALTFFFMGWYFKAYGLDEGYPYVSYIISGIRVIFMFTFPLLTMRSFAEEKRYRTDQLLFTAPVSARAVVAGKYAAAFVSFVISLPILIVFMLIMSRYGAVPFTENLIAVLYFGLFGMVCISIGIFISALSDNQIIAAVLTFFVLICSASVSGIVQSAGIKDPALIKLLGLADLSAPFENGMYGTLDLADPVYYITITVLMLYLTGFVLTARRLHVRTSGLLNASLSVIGLLIILITVALLNLGVRSLPLESRSFDLTYNKIRSLTDESAAVLKGLDNDITIYVYAEDESKDETIDSTLAYIAAASSHVKVMYVSPSSNPQFYRQYTDEKPSENSCIVVCGEKSRVIEYTDCYKLNYKYGYNAVSDSYVIDGYDVTGYDGEGKLISAIQYVTDAAPGKVYVLTGHDEAELSEDLKTRVENAHFEVESFNLLQYDEVPQDCDVLMVLGPLSDFNEDEAGKIKAYMEKDGAGIFVCAYTEGGEQKEYDALLADLGIEVIDGKVVESDENYYNNENSYLLPEILKTEWTGPVYTEGRTKYIYMPFSKGLKLIEAPGAECTSFLMSGPGSYIEKDGGYIEGPFTLGAYVKKYLDKGTFRAAVLASDYFMDPEIDKSVGGNNYTVFIKLLTNVAQTADSADIPVKTYEYDKILIPAGVRNTLGFVFMGVIPLIMLLGGLIVREVRMRR